MCCGLVFATHRGGEHGHRGPPFHLSTFAAPSAAGMLGLVGVEGVGCWILPLLFFIVT